MRAEGETATAAQNSASSIVIRSSKPIPFALPGTKAPCGGKRSPPSTVV